MILDLHLHTVLGSSDSSLTIEDAAKQLIKRGLDGACLTEHSSIWEKNKDHIRRNLSNMHPHEHRVSSYLNEHIS